MFKMIIFGKILFQIEIGLNYEMTPNAGAIVQFNS